ncbi:hypothetical protein F442_20956 [Phytophthora nicotianae P10297]|uniref:RxLR effector protein n=4 Tax=Phytophthora nicotianae TaxID=4792 RepID=W2PGV6_PHYN3|nr:hypothetical protein PPTG_18412 [Phytophthora nicotianae INRA-310]ETI34714.1 hypothetical protein F443_18883 [Phytophthora nicotianae P1569]ETK72309.1 hypothetical protein L915_20553 [Phytophthora nicotianae]ETP29941.1 hypothetical protein F442_20956 [Phytophthora nicotianae P10297]ETL78969.1 hypothetical protein L917_20292 [Phytophthora nicotianae]ETM99845.1 hypothetical protein PPTG_18412 [Phytophthora nicotianae INRA-310]
MRAEWRSVAVLLAVISLTGCAATTNGYGAGHVQAPDKENSFTKVKPGSNGYGTVTYASASSDSNDRSEDAANRLALEEAQAQHPNLRLRLSIGI